MRIRKIFCKSLGVQLLFLSVMCLLGYSVIVSAEDAEDWMPDPNLRMAVRQALKIDTDTPLTQADMAQLINFDTNRLQVTDKISNLKGLEYAINLKLLIVAQNRIQDLRPLAHLTNLTFLDLGGNVISDISPLAGLVRLEVLGLWYNRIVDISPLAGLGEPKRCWTSRQSDCRHFAACRLDKFEGIECSQ